MTMDPDSTVCQVHGYHKQGAAHGYTRTLGYHPVGAENLCTSRDLGVLVDQPTETIVPYNPHMGRWSGRRDGPQRWCLGPSERCGRCPLWCVM